MNKFLITILTNCDLKLLDLSIWSSINQDYENYELWTSISRIFPKYCTPNFNYEPEEIDEWALAPTIVLYRNDLTKDTVNNTMNFYREKKAYSRRYDQGIKIRDD